MVDSIDPPSSVQKILDKAGKTVATFGLERTQPVFQLPSSVVQRAQLLSQLVLCVPAPPPLHAAPAPSVPEAAVAEREHLESASR